MSPITAFKRFGRRRDSLRSYRGQQSCSSGRLRLLFYQKGGATGLYQEDSFKIP